MANRYWIGGAGNWNDVTHWSDSSGGVGGASVPTSSDNVFFDNNSGTGTITVNAIASMLDFDVTGLAQNITLANAAYTFNVYGNFKLSNYLLTSFTSTGYLYLKSTTSVGIWANGTTKNWNRIYFDGVGGIWTNQDDWNAGTSSINLTNGTWNQSTYNVSCKSFGYGVGTATLTMVSGIFSTIEGCFFHINSANKTFNCGNGTIKNTSTAGGNNLYVGTNTFYDVEAYCIASGSGSGLCRFRNLTVTGTATGTNGIILDEGVPSWTITGTFTVSGYNAAERRMFVTGLIGTPRTITCNGTIIASNVDFRDITGAGTANWDLSEITGGSGDAGGNSGIIFTPSQTLYFKHTSGAVNLSDSSKWFTTDGGSTLGRTPLPQDYAYFTANSFAGTSTITFNMPRFCGIDMSGVNQAVTLSQNIAIVFYGDYILGNNISTSLVGGSSVNLFGKSGVECKFNSYAKSLGASYLRIINGIYRNYSNIVMGNSNASQFHALRGTFYLNNYDLSCILFAHTNSGESYFNCYFYAGSGTITINGSSFDIYRVRFFAETSTIVMNSSATSDVSISIGSNWNSLVTINKLILQGTITGNYIISQSFGSTTINELTINAGKKVKFQGGRTFSVGKITAKGTNTNKIIIGSTTTTKANITYTGGIQPDIKFADISYINATNAFKVRASTDSGNNTNITFNSAKFWVGGTGNINDTSHWSDTSGGAGGAVLPTLTDDVFFDENSLGSDGQTITINTAFNCLSLDFEYLVNTMTLTNAVYNFSVYGGLFLSTKLTASFSSTGYLYLKSTTSVPIYSNSNASSWNRIYFDGVNGTWTLQDNWNAGTSTWIYLANGTLKLNTKTLTTNRFYFATGTKVLDISDSTLVSTEAINFNDNKTNATILANNSLIRLQQNSTGHSGFFGGGFLLNNVEIIQTNNAINGTIVGIYCNNLTLSGALHSFRPTFTHTINNNLTIVGNNSTNYRAFLNSETIGSQATVTCNGTVIASNVDFRDITGAGTANWDLSAITGGSGDAGGNSGIIFTPSQTQYFKDVTYLDKLNGSGNFENGLIGTIVLGTGQAATWTLNTVNPISGTRDGLLSVTVAGSSVSRPYLTFGSIYTTNKTYRWSFKYKVKSGSCRVNSIYNGVSTISVNQTLVGEGTFSFDILALGTTQPPIYFANLIGETQIDDFKVEEINSYGWSESTNWFSNIERTIAGRVPLPQDDPIFDNLSFAGTSLLSVNVPRIGRSLNMELVNQAVTFSLVNNIECYGSFVFGLNITLINNYYTGIGLFGTGNHLFAYNLSQFQNRNNVFENINFNRGIYTLHSNLHWWYGLSLQNVYLNNFNLFCLGTGAGGGCTIYKTSYLSNSIINVGSKRFEIFAGVNVFSETSTIILNPKTVNDTYSFLKVNGNQLNKVIFNGLFYSGIYTNSIINELIIESGKRLIIENGTTQKINKFTAVGTSSNPITIGSTTTGSTFTLTKTEPLNEKIECDYLILQDSTATPAKTWYAGLNSVNNGNNTGWVFDTFHSRDIIVQPNKRILVDNNGRIVW